MQQATPVEPGSELKRGTMVLACRQENRLAGEIMRFSPRRAALQFSRPVSPPFERAEEIQLNYWHDRDTLHVFQAQVLQVTGYGRQIETAIRSHTVEKRRLRRFEIPVTVFATVTRAEEKDLIGRRFVSETKNISLSGLLMETSLNLTLGDQLELELELSPDERLHTRVWVVRSRMERRKEFVGAVVIKSCNALGLEFELDQSEQRRLLQFLLQSGEGTSLAPTG